MKEKEDVYEKERIDDSIFMDIKFICMKYLQAPELIDDITDEEILLNYNFIFNKYEEITKLRKSLKIKPYNKPFYEIYTNLDNIISKDHLLQKEEKISFIELMKEINYLEESLGIYYSILLRIIKDRNVHQN